MEICRRKMALCEASVDEAAELIEEFCKNAGLCEKDALRYRLSLETVLLSWNDCHAADGFQLLMGKRFNGFYITLECRGQPADPYSAEAENDSEFIKSFRKNIGLSPQYSYRNGKNSCSLRFQVKELSALKKILLSIALALVLGLLTKLLLPSDLSASVLTGFIEPLNSAVFRLLSYVAGPLVLLSVIWGIYGIGDAAALGRLGRDLLLRFFIVCASAGIGCVLVSPVFHLNMAPSGGGDSAFQSIFEMILDIIPGDIISPLTTNNTMQIIFSAIIIGIAMLYLGREVQTFAEVIEEINAIIRLLMSFISRFIPAAVFLIIFRLILSDSLSVFIDVWKLFAVCVAVCAVFCAALTVITGIRQKVSPLLLFRKSIPTLLVTLTTASSAASFASNMETCEKRFGIDNSLTSFGIPLGMVLFKSASLIYLMLFSCHFAAEFDVPASPGWIATLAVMALLLSFSTPPVPGAGIITVTLLFNRLGIPSDALAVVLSVDALFDFLITTVNIYALPLTLINSASVQGLLNHDILRQKKSG